MFFRHGIEKVPFSRDSLENISFEPSRHPSALDEIPYRESFLAGFLIGPLGRSVSFQKTHFLAGMDKIPDFWVWQTSPYRKQQE